MENEKIIQKIVDEAEFKAHLQNIIEAIDIVITDLQEDEAISGIFHGDIIEVLISRQIELRNEIDIQNIRIVKLTEKIK